MMFRKFDWRSRLSPSNIFMYSSISIAVQKLEVFTSKFPSNMPFSLENTMYFIYCNDSLVASHQFSKSVSYIIKRFLVETHKLMNVSHFVKRFPVAPQESDFYSQRILICVSRILKSVISFSPKIL